MPYASNVLESFGHLDLSKTQSSQSTRSASQRNGKSRGRKFFSRQRSLSDSPTSIKRLKQTTCNDCSSGPNDTHVVSSSVPSGSPLSIFQRTWAKLKSKSPSSSVIVEDEVLNNGSVPKTSVLNTEYDSTEDGLSSIADSFPSSRNFLSVPCAYGVHQKTLIEKQISCDSRGPSSNSNHGKVRSASLSPRLPPVSPSRSPSSTKNVASCYSNQDDASGRDSSFNSNTVYAKRCNRKLECGNNSLSSRVNRNRKNEKEKGSHNPWLKDIDIAPYCSTTEDDFSEADAFPSFLRPKTEPLGAAKFKMPDGNAQICPAATAPDQLQPFFRESLFPLVPPTVRFCLPSEQVQKPRRSIRKTLKWCRNSLVPKVVRSVLSNSHFKIVPENSFWLGYWGKHLRTNNFKTILAYQKVNHFPGTFHLGRKDRLWTNIKSMMVKHGSDQFYIMPHTYVLPRDISKLKSKMQEHAELKSFILKPPASARGAGIKVIHRVAQIPDKLPTVAQVYIDRPFLISGSKFDLRLYVYITSFNPLRIYLYEDGLVRFASVKYSCSLKTIGNNYMHLTNYSINKTASDDEITSTTGSKWPVRQLWEFLMEQGYDVRLLMEQIVDLIIKSIISCENSISSYIRSNVAFAFTCHELFGFDVMFDEHLKPWLLEINISPSLHSATDLDVEIKTPIARDVLNLAGICVPDKQVARDCSTRLPPNLTGAPLKPHCLDFRAKVCEISDDERRKHEFYTSKFDKSGKSDSSILDQLTPNDIRVLVDVEDEFERRGKFTRIFPSPFSSGHLRYFERSCYFNLLIDEWIAQYYHIRQTGIEYLRNLCSEGAHLQRGKQVSEEYLWSERRKSTA